MNKFFLKGIFFCCATAITCSTLIALEPTFKLDFENGFDAVGKNGSKIAAKPYKMPKLSEGRLGGKALLSGPGTGCLDYMSEAVLNPQSGSLEMWISPLDWTATEKAFHVFFSAADTQGKGWLLLYKYYNDFRNLGFHSRSENSGAPTVSAMPIAHWQGGAQEWHHVAITWSEKGQMLYLDGVPAAAKKHGCALPKQLTGTFRLGDDDLEASAKRVNAVRTSSSLIDDVMIYDCELSAAQIKAHYQGIFAAMPLSVETAKLNFSIDIQKKIISFEFNLNAPDYEDNRLQVNLSAGDKAVKCPVTGNKALLQLPLTTTIPEKINFSAEVLLDGKKSYDFNQIITFPDLSWIGNDIGKVTEVPPPWTPLQTSANQINCWGRQYQFGKDGLPEKVISAGENLLAAPITLTAKDNAGKIIQWQNDGFVPGANSALIASGTGGIFAVGASGKIAIKTAVKVEYDGMMLIDLTLADSVNSGDITEMSIDIPLNDKFVLYRHRDSMSGALGKPATGSNVIESWQFAAPFIWLGDNDRGLFWFCESAKMWPNFSSNDAIQVLRENDRVILRLNLLKKGQSLPHKWGWQCGLLATPVKPFTRRNRSLDLNLGKAGVATRILWPSAKTMNIFGYAEGKEPELSDYLKKYPEMKFIPYSCLTALNTKAPEWPLFNAWRTPYDWGRSPDAVFTGGGFVYLDQRAPLLADFMAYKNQQFVKKYGFVGLYHDLTSSLNVSRPGEPFFYSFLAQRELYRRSYIMMKKLNPDSFIIAHMSGHVVPTTLAYVDAYLTGEQTRGKVKNYYLEVLPLDFFRTEFCGRQFGIESLFLPQVDAKIQKDNPEKFDQITREAIMYCLLHDVTCWAWSINMKLVTATFDQIAKEGIANAEFIRYDDKNAPLAGLPDNVFASASKLPNGRILLYLCNFSESEKNVKSTLNGLKPAKAQIINDNNREITVANGVVEITLPAKDFRIIALQP